LTRIGTPGYSRPTMDLRRVDSSSDLETFIKLPFSVYRNDPIWVPQPLASIRAEFSPRSNPFLAHCDYAFFLLEKEGRAVGRIAALIDRLAVESWGSPIGMFAYFECPLGEKEGAVLLLDAARAWLGERGMERMRGPWSFVSQEWGLVVEGFSPRPVVMAPYNPPGYAGLLEGYGLSKAKDLLCWEISIDEGYRIPERIIDLTDEVARRHGVRIRTIDFSRYEEEVRTFASLSLDTLKDNWGISPITDAEIAALAKDLRQFIRSDCVLFAREPGGRDIGFALIIPDINEILIRTRGRMLPLGWLRLLLGIPRLKRYRMFGLGVDGAWRGKGIDALLYRAMWERMAGPGVSMEINYVLEDNLPMINAISKLGARPSRRYRVYEMPIG
jgi:GNAT superfamily N-acetyltransferase